MHCLPDHDFITPHPTEAPLILCSICHRWREVALSTPGLWSSLFLDFDAMVAEEGCADLYQMWLSWARGTPLLLFIQDIEQYEVPAGPVASLLKNIFGLSRQWHKIELDLGHESTKFLFPREGTLPLFDKLSVAVFPSDPPMYFLDAPKLHEVSIDI
ncbi:hypothetical protein B0H19DRAFT_1273368 [Mycena capillaripes]|nr:hypothetical protein B0H19DRAFT_1273368 [Mycena capillaripes]